MLTTAADIKRDIIINYIDKWKDHSGFLIDDIPSPYDLNDEKWIDLIYYYLKRDSRFVTLENEYRKGEVQTVLHQSVSKEYNIQSVATQTQNGNWVGWDYYYPIYVGHPKYEGWIEGSYPLNTVGIEKKWLQKNRPLHLLPEAVEWIEDAYDLDCVEQEKVVVVRTFTRKETEDKL